MHRVLFTTMAVVLLGGSGVYAQEPADEPAAEPQAGTPAEQPAKQAEATVTGPEPADPAGTEKSGTETPETEKPGGEGDKPGAPDPEEKTVLDDQTFEGEDDEFIPTEEIPLSEPIPFPVDI
jgi:hypothetical protein